MQRHLVDMEPKAPVPFERTRELERERLDLGVAEAWVEDEGLHVGSKAKGTMNVRLDVDEMARHPSYRGPEYVALGRSLAVDGWLTPAILEMAVRTERHHPQDLKKVWHYLARFGDRASGRFQAAVS